MQIRREGNAAPLLTLEDLVDKRRKLWQLCPHLFVRRLLKVRAVDSIELEAIAARKKRWPEARYDKVVGRLQCVEIGE